MKKEKRMRKLRLKYRNRERKGPPMINSSADAQTLVYCKNGGIVSLMWHSSLNFLKFRTLSFHLDKKCKAHTNPYCHGHSAVPRGASGYRVPLASLEVVLVTVS